MSLKLHELLIEVGVEELPAGYLRPALLDFSQKLRRALVDHRLANADLQIRELGTPRRLTLHVSGVFGQQESSLEEIWGPALKAAKDKNGAWTAAAEGFAAKNGVALSEIAIAPDAKGVEKLLVKRNQSERLAGDVLVGVLPDLIRSITFPKSMRFVPGKPLRFARPIRSLMAFLDRDCLSFSLDGIVSGAVVRGHRFLAGNALLEVRSADLVAYIDLLRAADVLVDRSERREKVCLLLKDALAKATSTPVWEECLDERLIDTVTDCVEQASVVKGSFDKAYLDLPSVVPITSMKHHQKYFPVIDAEKGLQPVFLSVTNGCGLAEVIRCGNERVLSARLADALFFWNEDLKTPLASRYEDLKAMCYHKEIGSYWDKSESMRVVARRFGLSLGLSTEELSRVDRAVMLLKVDLLTHMVYEFPELQGLMGREYALRFGEDAVVATVLAEQYQGAPGSTRESDVVQLAERWDTLQVSFRAGLKVSGSSDPYGLRRAAFQMIAILDAKGYSLELDDARVAPFLLERLRSYAQEQFGIRYDVLDAVFATAGSALNVVSLLERARTLQKMLLEDPSFEAVLLVVGRVVNILKQAEEKNIALLETVREDLLEEEAEKTLYRALSDSGFLGPEMGDLSLEDLLARLGSLRFVLDLFFEDVMVFSEDKSLCANRLALLRLLSRSLDSVADLSLITSI